MFKPSHLQTPRTMAETNFTTGYYSAQPQRPMDREDRIVMWGCAIGAILTLAVILFFPEVR